MGLGLCYPGPNALSKSRFPAATHAQAGGEIQRFFTGVNNRSSKVAGPCSLIANVEPIEWFKAGSALNIFKKQTVSV